MLDRTTTTTTTTTTTAAAVAVATLEQLSQDKSRQGALAMH